MVTKMADQSSQQPEGQPTCTRASGTRTGADFDMRMHPSPVTCKKLTISRVLVAAAAKQGVASARGRASRQLQCCGGACSRAARCMPTRIARCMPTHIA